MLSSAARVTLRNVIHPTDAAKKADTIAPLPPLTKVVDWWEFSGMPSGHDLYTELLKYACGDGESSGLLSRLPDPSVGLIPRVSPSWSKGDIVSQLSRKSFPSVVEVGDYATKRGEGTLYVAHSSLFSGLVDAPRDVFKLGLLLGRYPIVIPFTTLWEFARQLPPKSRLETMQAFARMLNEMPSPPGAGNDAAEHTQREDAKSDEGDIIQPLRAEQADDSPQGKTDAKPPSTAANGDPAEHEKNTTTESKTETSSSKATPIGGSQDLRRSDLGVEADANVPLCLLPFVHEQQLLSAVPQKVAPRGPPAVALAWLLQAKLASSGLQVRVAAKNLEVHRRALECAVGPTSMTEELQLSITSPEMTKENKRRQKLVEQMGHRLLRNERNEIALSYGSTLAKSER